MVKSSKQATLYLGTSDYGVLVYPANGSLRLIKDPTLKASEKFRARTGNLLLIRRVDLFNTLKVAAVVPREPATATMWFPAETRSINLSDGEVLSASKSAVVIALWFQSTLNLLLLLGEREETRGGWGEWKTQKIRNFPILDISKLNSRAVNQLFEIWHDICTYKWELLKVQLRRAIYDVEHPRRKIDKAFCKVLGISLDLEELYRSLYREVNLLGKIMGKMEAIRALEHNP